MIVVKVREDRVDVTGHANYAELGGDIVCAAMSILVQNLVDSIHSLTEDHIIYLAGPGDVHIEYKNLSERSRTLVDSFFIGCLAIAAEYPNYVTIN